MAIIGLSQQSIIDCAAEGGACDSREFHKTLKQSCVGSNPTMLFAYALLGMLNKTIILSYTMERS